MRPRNIQIGQEYRKISVNLFMGSSQDPINRKGSAYTLLQNWRDKIRRFR